MKIITSFTVRLDDPELNVIEETSIDYKGPVAQCGGSGGGGQAYYDQLNNLYGIQADQAQYLMGVAKDTVIPGYKDFMQESRDYGSQANQEKAASDAGAAASSANTGARQQMQSDMASMGINPNDERYQKQFAAMGTQGAASEAAAMTGARENVRQQGLSRMQDAVSLGMGTPTQASAAAQGATYAAASGANLYANQRAQDAQGIAGAARGAFDIYSAWNGGSGGFADGGEVAPQGLKRASGFVNKYAIGGIVSMRPNMQITPPPAMGPGKPSTAQQVGQYGRMASTGASVAKAGAPIAKSVAGQMDPGSYLATPQGVAGTDAAEAQGTSQGITQAYGASTPGNGYAQLYNAASDQVDGAMGNIGGLGDTAASTAGTDAAVGADAGAAGATTGGAGAGAAGAAAGADAAAGAGTTLGTAGAVGAGEAAGATAAGAAAADAAVTAGAAEGAGAVAAEALPYLAVLAANGGSIQPPVTPGSNGTMGGTVEGPGGPKDDLIPAMLSHGEFVMPVGTVLKYGVDKLEKMRQEGLQHEAQLGIHKPGQPPAAAAQHAPSHGVQRPLHRAQGGPVPLGGARTQLGGAAPRISIPTSGRHLPGAPRPIHDPIPPNGMPMRKPPRTPVGGVTLQPRPPRGLGLHFPKSPGVR
jgi:hypothetical protein